MAKTKAFPAKLGPCIDLAYTAREARLALQRRMEAELAKLKEQEEAINQHIVDTFDADEIGKASGTLASASISLDVKPTVDEETGGWPAFFAWVAKTKSFDMLYKQVSAPAYRARLDAGKVVPGMKQFTAKKLHLTKIG